jgi:NADH dehydrogenase
VGLGDVDKLSTAMADCDAVAHLAGINRELGAQTYAAVHVAGTEHVVEAAQRAGVRKLALLSFLRARPASGSAYHDSKWAAEEIVRTSGLDYTILKAGVIYGQGDHMLDHLSHAFFTFPVFGLVGMREQPVAPVAVEDVVRVLVASLVDGRLSGETVAVIGPEVLTLGVAVRRVAAVVEQRPLFVRLPLAFHYGFAWLAEQVMTIPLIARAQVRILSESLIEAGPGVTAALPVDLVPRISFDAASIRRGLPGAGAFGRSDLRCCTGRSYGFSGGESA